MQEICEISKILYTISENTIDDIYKDFNGIKPDNKKEAEEFITETVIQMVAKLIETTKEDENYILKLIYSIVYQAVKRSNWENSAIINRISERLGQVYENYGESLSRNYSFGNDIIVKLISDKETITKDTRGMFRDYDGIVTLFKNIPESCKLLVYSIEDGKIGTLLYECEIKPLYNFNRVEFNTRTGRLDIPYINVNYRQIYRNRTLTKVLPITISDRIGTEDEIVKIIRNDDIDRFTDYFIDSDIEDLKERAYQRRWFFNTNRELLYGQNITPVASIPTLLMYFGAVKCFKYFLENNFFEDYYFNRVDLQCLIMGNNLEIFHLLEQHEILDITGNIDTFVFFCISTHRNDFLDWILTRYFHIVRPLSDIVLRHLIQERNYDGVEIFKKHYEFDKGAEGFIKLQPLDEESYNKTFNKYVVRYINTFL